MLGVTRYSLVKASPFALLRTHIFKREKKKNEKKKKKESPFFRQDMAFCQGFWRFI